MKNLVVAYDKQRGIGKDNDLLWDYRAIPSDMARFRELTTGHAIVMGRKTFDSLRRPLPNRRNIVISNKVLEIVGAEVVSSLDAAYAAVPASEDVYIIGGGQIYAESIDTADRIYATEIDETFEGADTFFPTIDDTWQVTAREHLAADDRNQYSMDFVTYDKQ